MDPRRAGSVLLILLAVLVIGWAGLNVAPKGGGSTDAPADAGAASAIVLTHKLEGTTHTYEGELTTPTPCYDLAASIAVTFGAPPTGDIAVTATEQEGTICAQVVTRQPFTVALISEETPEIRVTVNGEPRSASIVEGR